MAYLPSDFGPAKVGPQFAWLEQRLTVHGYPSRHVLDTVKDRTQRFQWAQGWTGRGADGFVGPETLRRLTLVPGIDLSRWKLTLPTGEEDHPTEWFPIGTHEDAPWFVNHGVGGCRFRAPVDGVTTRNSDYCRSELREMNTDGTKAGWSNRAETHRLTVTCAVTALPGGKREAVFGQVHDADDDVVMLLVSGDRVYASWSKGKDQGSERVLLFSGYKLGDRLTYTITAGPDGITVKVNGYESSKQKLIDGAYFKAGCYSQANESNGTGYGEVLILNLSL